MLSVNHNVNPHYGQPLDIIEKTNQFYDYIPIVSTIANLIDLFQKHVVMPLQSLEVQKSTPYYSYLKDKSSLRCVILLIPILGNIAIACYDHYMEAKTKSSQQPQQHPTNSPDLSPSQGIIPSTEISPFPLLKLPKELLPAIFSSLSLQELGRLASVSKATRKASIDESIWEKLCKEEDQQLSQTKPAERSWKTFYRDEIDLRNYEKDGRMYFIKHATADGQLRTSFLKANKQATVLHVKKLLSRKHPHLSVKDIDLMVSGKVGQDDKIFSSYDADSLTVVWAAKKLSV